MDLQPRAPEHGVRWHHADAEIGASRLAPLLLSVKSGGDYPYGVVFGEDNPIGLVPVGSVVFGIVGDCSARQYCIDATVTIDCRGIVTLSPAPESITHTLRLRRLI